MERDLVLLGGGHAHVLAIRQLAMKPLPGVRVTLISEQTLTPYSGMLPGFIAGHYSFEETHIDLNRLCRRCHVRWIPARATGLDLSEKRVLLEDVTAVDFDWLSVDTGSRPDTRTPGAAQFAVGVKPVSGFAAKWHAVLDQLREPGNDLVNLGVIGAGAGGVELVLAIAHRLRTVSRLRCHLIYPGQAPLSGYPKRVVDTVERALNAHEVAQHANFRVAEVRPDKVVDAHARTVALNHTLWCTAASAPPWPRDAGLATDEHGFITVDESLRSVSHPCVFAAGDIAHMPFDPRPKAGVYAVRQAPWLIENMRRVTSGREVKPIRLQRQFLSLLSLGSQRAVGTRNGFSLDGGWVWRMKDRIDRAFMRRVNEAGGDMKATATRLDDAQMHCAGCASKLGPQVVKGNLQGVRQFENAAVVPALANAEDAAKWYPTAGRVAVQSLDGFRAFTLDEYRFGQIVANHALSDIYAMGATPVSALVWAGLGFNHPRLHARDHRRLMSGIADSLVSQACVLAGGHSSEGCEAHAAIAVTGDIDAGALIEKQTGQPGDWLLLTKPLGTGVILAANMTGDAPAASVDAAFDAMMENNMIAGSELRAAHALTDVTGFGLLGHLLEMLSPTDLFADVELDEIPVLTGAITLLQAGYRSTLYPELRPLLAQTNRNDDTAMTAICLDPQTSGGLLAALSPGEARAVLERQPSWAKIGVIRSRSASDGDHLVCFHGGQSA